jgi:hypothetical protein
MNRLDIDLGDIKKAQHIARMNTEAGVEGARAWCMSVFELRCRAAFVRSVRAAIAG